MNLVIMSSILLCSLLILFINFSACHPTDYSLEVKTLLKLEGIENATSDVKRFAKKVVKMKRNYKNEVSEKDRQLGEMKYQKEVCKGFLIELVCGKNFRFGLETFGNDYGVQNEDINKHLNVLKSALQAIREKIEMRRQQLRNCVYGLQKLYDEYNPKSMGLLAENGSSTWNCKVKNVFQELQMVQISVKKLSEDIENLETPNLSDLIVQFYLAENENQAVALFQNQCSQHFWSSDSIEEQEEDVITNLTLQWPDNEKDSLIPTKNEKGFTMAERRFLTGVLKTGRYFILESKTYRHCVEVFYFARSKFIRIYKDKLRSQWPERDYPTLVDKFCYRFHTLYNRISIRDTYAPASIPDDCYPNSTDYLRFIKRLAPSPLVIDDYIFIGTTLGFIKAPTKE